MNRAATRDNHNARQIAKCPRHKTKPHNHAYTACTACTACATRCPSRSTASLEKQNIAKHKQINKQRTLISKYKQTMNGNNEWQQWMATISTNPISQFLNLSLFSLSQFLSLHIPKYWINQSTQNFAPQIWKVAAHTPENARRHRARSKQATSSSLPLPLHHHSHKYSDSHYMKT